MVHFLASLAIGVAPAQPAALDSIGPRLQRLADSIVAARPQLPALLIYVKSARSGRQWAIAAGLSDTAKRVRARPDQPLRIASNTKTYTAAAILRLMEQGKLRLSDPIDRHLPADLARLLAADGYPIDRMTIEQVLSHRAGLAEHPEVPSYVTSIRATPKKRWTRLEQVQWLVDSLTPIGSPGERFKYSDTGYILLGAIIERYTGKNYGLGTRELLSLDRLGLRHTWFETLEPAPPTAGERIHQYMGGIDSYDLDPSFDLYGGGGVASTVAELGGFLEALGTGRVFERRATLDTMVVARSPDLGGYGLGIYNRVVRGKRGYGHSGFWGTAALYFPDDQITIAVAVTEQSQGGLTFAVVAAALGIVAP